MIIYRRPSVPSGGVAGIRLRRQQASILRPGYCRADCGQAGFLRGRRARSRGTCPCRALSAVLAWGHAQNNEKVRRKGTKGTKGTGVLAFFCRARYFDFIQSRKEGRAMTTFFRHYRKRGPVNTLQMRLQG